LTPTPQLAKISATPNSDLNEYFGGSGLGGPTITPFSGKGNEQRITILEEKISSWLHHALLRIN